MDNFNSLPLEERQRILAKLAKLKALADCETGNVNETATAAAAMTRLMMEYKIEMAELQTEALPSLIVEEDATGERKSRRYPIWQSALLTLLSQANDCLSFEMKNYEPLPWGGYETVVTRRLIGCVEDIAQTRTLFLYCLQEIERLCSAWGARAPVARKNDFRRGAAHSIGQRAVQERQQVVEETRQRAAASHQTSRALVMLDQRLEAVEAAARVAGVKSVQRSARPVSASAYQAGIQAGAKVDLGGVRDAPRALVG